MSDKPWFPFWHNDFREKTFRLTFEEQGVYIGLLSICWAQKDVGLPDDLEWIRHALLAHGPAMHGHTFKKLVPPLIGQFFIKDSDGKWRNKKLTEIHFGALKVASNARQSAVKRWSTYNEIKDLPYARAMLTQHKERKKEGEQGKMKVSDELLRRLGK